MIDDTVVPIIPGEITYFLNRTTIKQLKETRSSELNKHFLLCNYKLVALIDERLYKKEKVNQND